VSGRVEPGRFASDHYLRLARRSNRALERVLIRGETPNVDSLVGWEFRGTNTPWTAWLLRIRKFVKGFYRDSQTGSVCGYNIPVIQNGLDKAWLARPSESEPKRFGFFSVTPVDATARDNAYLHALLLDYSGGGNPRLDVTNLIRDYLVRVEPGSDDVLLGKVYIAIGSIRIPASYFVLERYGPTAYTRSRIPLLRS
jgi:hypothetical protein